MFPPLPPPAGDKKAALHTKGRGSPWQALFSSSPQCCHGRSLRLLAKVHRNRKKALPKIRCATAALSQGKHVLVIAPRLAACRPGSVSMGSRVKLLQHWKQQCGTLELRPCLWETKQPATSSVSAPDCNSCQTWVHSLEKNIRSSTSHHSSATSYKTMQAATVQYKHCFAKGLQDWGEAMPASTSSSFLRLALVKGKGRTAGVQSRKEQPQPETEWGPPGESLSVFGA